MDKSQIWTMFDKISPSYDLVNRLLSFSIDKRWRKKCADFVPNRPNLCLLDIATGTGDQLIALMDQCSNIRRSLGIDMAREMLSIGREKLKKKSYNHLVDLTDGTALSLPVASSSMDVISIAFGVRNFTDLDQCLKECFRALTPEGKLIILEFSLPRNQWIRKFHLFYLRKIVPWIGGLISKNQEAYRYLNTTIESFPFGEEFVNIIRKEGFSQVSFFPLTFGIATIYVAERSKT